MPEPIVLAWSGGKDSTMSLYELHRDGQYRVTALLTTITETYDRISMHGVRRALLERQAESLGLPLHPVLIPTCCRNKDYEEKMKEALSVHQARGLKKVAFGDIFLQDLRAYREKNLALIGMHGVFPIWQRDTRELVRTFLDLGFRAIVTCVDPKVLDASFAGRFIDEEFLAQLPPNVDPCGETGEFHSFVFDGPVFQRPIPVTRGEVVTRSGFVFCDLLPA